MCLEQCLRLTCVCTSYIFSAPIFVGWKYSSVPEVFNSSATLRNYTAHTCYLSLNQISLSVPHFNISQSSFFQLRLNLFPIARRHNDQLVRMDIFLCHPCHISRSHRAILRRQHREVFQWPFVQEDSRHRRRDRLGCLK